MINKKNQIAKTYDNFFSKYKYFKVPKVRKSDYHAYHLYPLLIDFKKINISKNNLFNYFQKKIFDYKLTINQYILSVYIKKNLNIRKKIFQFQLIFLIKKFLFLSFQI